MKLYHGTSARYLDSIRKKGLVPRGKSHGNWRHSVMSRSDAIYLTTAYAPYFAIQATAKGDVCLVVEIDTAKLNPFALAPDEDCLEQMTRRTKTGVPPEWIKWPMEKRTKWFRKRLEDYTGHDQWKSSLRLMGNCCYLGPIPPEAITRFAVFEPLKCLHFSNTSLDPFIAIENYQYCGDKYRGLTKWLFGDDLGDDAPQQVYNFDAFKGISGLTEEQALAATFSYRLPPDEERNAIRVIEMEKETV